jgi:hypothetical protein
MIYNNKKKSDEKNKIEKNKILEALPSCKKISDFKEFEYDDSGLVFSSTRFFFLYQLFQMINNRTKKKKKIRRGRRKNIDFFFPLGC